MNIESREWKFRKVCLNLYKIQFQTSLEIFNNLNLTIFMDNPNSSKAQCKFLHTSWQPNSVTVLTWTFSTFQRAMLFCASNFRISSVSIHYKFMEQSNVMWWHCHDEILITNFPITGDPLSIMLDGREQRLSWNKFRPQPRPLIGAASLMSTKEHDIKREWSMMTEQKKI